MSGEKSLSKTPDFTLDIFLYSDILTKGNYLK